MAGFQAPPPGALPGVGSPDISDESIQSMLGGSSSGSQSATAPHLPKPPKPAPALGSPTEEAKHIASGVGQEFFEFLPPFMKDLLGEKATDSPEEAARKRQMLQNYQKLNAEEQQYVQKKIQKEQMEKRQREEEEFQRRQQLAAAQSSDLPVPEGKKTGEAAMGAGKSQKSQTLSKLQNDRKKMSSSG
jgi:hypothetical protein